MFLAQAWAISFPGSALSGRSQAEGVLAVSWEARRQPRLLPQEQEQEQEQVLFQANPRACQHRRSSARLSIKSAFVAQTTQ